MITVSLVSEFSTSSNQTVTKFLYMASFSVGSKSSYIATSIKLIYIVLAEFVNVTLYFGIPSVTKLPVTDGILRVL